MECLWHDLSTAIRIAQVQLRLVKHIDYVFAALKTFVDRDRMPFQSPQSTREINIFVFHDHTMTTSQPERTSRIPRPQSVLSRRMVFDRGDLVRSMFLRGNVRRWAKEEIL